MTTNTKKPKGVLPFYGDVVPPHLIPKPKPKTKEELAAERRAKRRQKFRENLVILKKAFIALVPALTIISIIALLVDHSLSYPNEISFSRKKIVELRDRGRDFASSNISDNYFSYLDDTFRDVTYNPALHDSLMEEYKSAGNDSDKRNKIQERLDANNKYSEGHHVALIMTIEDLLDRGDYGPAKVLLDRYVNRYGDKEFYRNNDGELYENIKHDLNIIASTMAAIDADMEGSQNYDRFLLTAKKKFQLEKPRFKSEDMLDRVDTLIQLKADRINGEQKALA